MLELVRAELFGTAGATPFQYFLAVAFVIYPFISLPLLVYLIKRQMYHRSGDSIRFQRPRKIAASLPAEAPPVRRPSEARHRSVAERLTNLLETGTVDQRLEAASVLADMGMTSALDSFDRLDRELSTDNIRPIPLREHKESQKPRGLEAAARVLLLSDESTASLRTAALNFLLESKDASPRTLARSI